MLSLATPTPLGHRRRSSTRHSQRARPVSSNRAQAKPSTVKEETARAQGAQHPSTCEWRQLDTANGELETKTNRVTSDAWLFQYDVLGNLLTVGLPNGDLVEYLVDAMGRRVGKKKNGVLLKQWIYRNALKPVAELDGAGALVAEFVYGSKSNVPDYVRRGGATYRVVSDHLGSPRYMVNVANSGEVPFSASYTSFGEVAGTGLDWMPFGFAGGIYDGDTGLVRFGARDYDPLVGRWTAKDPKGFAASQLNFFVYVANDPVNLLDESGLDASIFGLFTRQDSCESAEARFPGSGACGGIGTQGDAYRHCLSSCELTQAYGRGYAEFLGDLNEDAFPDPPDERLMDEKNNSNGCDFGESEDVDCSLRCYSAALHGELTTLR